MGAFDQQTRFGLRDVPIYVIAPAIGLHPFVLRSSPNGSVTPHRRHGTAPAASFKRHSASRPL
jgi:hypothetical protein